MIPLIDGHTHLEEIEDLVGAISRAEEVGVLDIITVGSDLESNKRALDIAGRYGKTVVHAALGIHPWNLDPPQLGSTIKFIEDHMSSAVAVGEIGLDYWLKDARKDPARRELQKEVFSTLLDLSKHCGKPAIIHCRGAWEDCLDLTMEAQVPKGVFHWFSGPLEVLDQVLNQGYFISATPAAEYSKKHITAIIRTPLERMLLETDTPVTYQYKRAEPADVRRTLEAVSRIKGTEREEVARITTQNAKELFELE